MATPKQIAANRRNAQKSCGPKSAETKAKVSHNPVRHGLCAKFQVLEEVEKQENFDAFLQRLIEDEQPVGEAEIELVVKMAEHTWLAKRALRMQNNCFTLEPKTPEQAKNGHTPVAVDYHLERYVRYHAAQDRAYHRASIELQKRKKARQLDEIGFASQKRKRVEEARAQAEEARKAEKHSLDLAVANLRKQREEIKLANDLAEILSADTPRSARGTRADAPGSERSARSNFDISSLHPASSAAAPHPIPPVSNGD